MAKLQEVFGLSARGYSDLKKGIAACTLTNFASMLGVVITVQVFVQLFVPFTGGAVSWSRLWLLFGLGLAAAVVQFLCGKNDYRHTYVACYTAAQDSRLQIAEIVRKLPMRVFDTRDLTELTANMMNDCEAIEHAMSHVVPPLVAGVISSTAVCAMLAFFDWRMALALFCTLPLSFLIMLGSRKVQEKLNQKQVQARLRASRETQDYLDGMKIIKACHLDGEKFAALKDAFENLRHQSVRMEMGTGILTSGAQFVLQAGIGVAIFVGARLLAGGGIGLMPLLVSLVVSTRVYGPILSILTILPMMFHMLAAARHLRDLAALPAMSGNTELALPSCDVALDGVGFRYLDSDVLRNFTARVPQGAVTALVGPSGSGKTTVAKLIARFWDVDAGAVTLGGVDVKTLDPEALMGKMAFVFQDVTLFSDTVMNNIRIGNLDAGDEEVYAAAKAAHCDEFIRRLPQGYQTLLGENGNTLSGGERQRISIARAMLKNAPVVLLDEATASLDPESEVYVQRAISRLIAGKTVLVIAHRLRTVAGVDQILVLSGGAVAEAGTHESLMAKEGLYHKLYTIQQASAGWSV
ncbi:ABC transporter ATP-binding protein/permease [Clostridia bacterium OttesenSCG-928-O13]|nr:ABC transporter ATP-binding protein/permease [Clostridia bacterium OttesenSCG-928-O13]